MFLIVIILNTPHRENKSYQIKFNKKVLLNYTLKIFHYYLKKPSLFLNKIFLFTHFSKYLISKSLKKSNRNRKSYNNIQLL